MPAPDIPSGSSQPTFRAESDPKATVLLVEDAEAVRRIGEGMLRFAGYDVIAVADGKTAVSSYREQPDRIDVVLLDVVMRGMSGIEVAEELRRIDPSVNIILTSGGHEETQSAAKRFGAGWVVKPCNLNDLSSAIEAQLTG